MEIQTAKKNGVRAMLSRGYSECYSIICNGRKTQTIVRLVNGEKKCICMQCLDDQKGEPTGEMIRY